MIPLRKHVYIGLGYFVIAACLGAILRLFSVVELPITYTFFVHTHSHIALLGWVYVVLTTMLYKHIQSPELDKKYRRIFLFTQVTLIGMLLSFPFQGYALFSIIFSTLFLFSSYWFFFFFARHTSSKLKSSNGYTCIQAALLYMVVSSIGPWALGLIMNTIGTDSVWYRMAIYFYLHFQYNGWMILALIGLFFLLAEEKGIKNQETSFKRFFWTFNAGVILSFFLSTLFAEPHILIYCLGGVGALLQLISFWYLVKIFKTSTTELSRFFTPFHKAMLKTVLGTLLIKMTLQVLTAIPYFAKLAATVIDLTIGYLHWTFLGVVSLALFFFLAYYRFLKISKKAYLLYLLGFLITEFLIFYKGIMVWQGSGLFRGYFSLLATGSILIALTLAFVFVSNLINKEPK